MKKISRFLFFACVSFMVFGCKQNDNNYKSKLDVKVEPVNVTFNRYEEVLFNLDTVDFQSSLMAVQDQYQVFLGGDLTNPNAVKYLKDFATDPYCIGLYQKVKNAFPDLNEVKNTVEGVFSHFHYYFPEIQLPENAYTCITGINADEPAVQILNNNLVISLDWYLDYDEIYDQIGMPKYIQHRTRKANLACDVAEQIYLAYLYQWRKQGNVMNEMVYSGRMNFFMEALCPDLTDDILFSWLPEQLAWAVENEGMVWADIVGQKRLYETGLDSYLMYFGDGPFTQAYGNDAPSRLGEYFGTQIIRSYFASHDVSLRQLIDINDLQGIFQDSGYKPMK